MPHGVNLPAGVKGYTFGTCQLYVFSSSCLFAEEWITSRPGGENSFQAALVLAELQMLAACQSNSRTLSFLKSFISGYILSYIIVILCICILGYDLKNKKIIFATIFHETKSKMQKFLNANKRLVRLKCVKSVI